MNARPAIRGRCLSGFFSPTEVDFRAFTGLLPAVYIKAAERYPAIRDDGHDGPRPVVIGSGSAAVFRRFGEHFPPDKRSRCPAVR